MGSPRQMYCPVLRQNVSAQFQLLQKALPSLLMMTRGSTNWKRKVHKREDKKETGVEYVGENCRRADCVYAWGCAETGALGIASYLRPEKYQRPILRHRQPARVKFFESNHILPYIVSCGYGFTVYAVKSKHGLQLLGTGVNTSSQIGFHEEHRNSGRMLDYLIEPVPIHLPVDKPNSTRVRSIGCGRAHTVVVTENSGVFSLGSNAYGQCCRPIIPGEDFSKTPLVHAVQDIPDNVEQVTCGQDHTIFTTTSGELYACGMGADGQTGQGHYDMVSKPSLVGGDVKGEKIVQVHSRADCVLAVSDKGDVFGWGNSEYSQFAMVTDHSQISTPRHLPIKNCGHIVKAVAAGSMCALLNGHLTMNVKEVAIWQMYQMQEVAWKKSLKFGVRPPIWRDKGQVFVWGYGILGRSPEVGISDTPIMIPEPVFGQHALNEDNFVVDIDCGLGNFVALNDEGNLYSWGHNRQGCLGLLSGYNQFFPLRVSVPAKPYTVTCGVDHTVVLCKSFN